MSASQSQPCGAETGPLPPTSEPSDLVEEITVRIERLQNPINHAMIRSYLDADEAENHIRDQLSEAGLFKRIRNALAASAPGSRDLTQAASGTSLVLAKLDIVAAQALAWRRHAERLRAAIGWVERPFADEATPESEVRQRISFLIEDAARSDAILVADFTAADTSDGQVSPGRDQ